MIGWVVGKVGERKGEEWGVIQSKWVSEWGGGGGWALGTEYHPSPSSSSTVLTREGGRGAQMEWGRPSLATVSEGLYIGPFVSPLAPFFSFAFQHTLVLSF